MKNWLIRVYNLETGAELNRFEIGAANRRTATIEARKRTNARYDRNDTRGESVAFSVSEI